MAFVEADRVKEQSTTTGTGTYSLNAGVPTGFRGFVAGVGDANYCNYVAENGTDWECGIGLVTDAATDTLARTVVLASSNAGAAVNWAAGTRNIYCGPIASNRNPKTARLAADHSVTGVTGTEVTGLQFAALQPGLYQCTYHLINSSGTSTTGVGLGINFTGTAARKTIMRRNVATITTASNGLTEEESGAALVTGGVLNGWASKAYSTTSPNMVSAGVGVINVDLYDIIEVTIEVTAAGDLELWHSSEIAATTTIIESGSCAILTRID
ncbi:MAG: hypothetical protein NT117_00160 [Gammaproteobacteria bacterium]|nr:hypothetical protein [Gammaproteobacteria bacterium]